MITALRNRCQRGKAEMANELYFIFETRGELDAVREFFLNRLHYVKEGDVVAYENGDTDFSFGIEFYDENLDQESLPEIKGPHINVRINYLRPTTYIVEIVKELREFEKQFKFIFYDEVRGEIAPFDVKKFEKEWKKANAAGLKGNQQKFDISLKPKKFVEHLWSWNSNRRSMETAAGEEYYFAKAMYFRQRDSNETPQALITWPDLIPIVFPVFVDRVIVIRSERVKSGILDRVLGRKPEDLQFMKDFSLQEILDTNAFRKEQFLGGAGWRLTQREEPKLIKLFNSVDLKSDTIHARDEIISQQQVVETHLVNG
jgi:hypothetical protein